MRQCDQKSYAYILVQLIKVSSRRSLDDVFNWSDFDLQELNLCDCALGTISLSELQGILRLMESERKKLEEKKHISPTYQDMRIIFMPTTFYR